MNEQQKLFTPRVILQLLIFIVLIPFLPLLISQKWDWWEAWVYAIISIGGFVISRILAARRNPDLLVERGRFMQHADTKSWDNILTPLLGLSGLFTHVIAGMDALGGWSPAYGLVTKLIALAILLVGSFISYYALVENRFFSGVVRIQADRGQQVVTSGPYCWVRHPGYAGGLLAYLATPVFLDSYWVYIPVMFTTIILVIRTALEDKTLHAELKGYRAYAQNVRYRLVPGLW